MPAPSQALTDAIETAETACQEARTMDVAKSDALGTLATCQADADLATSNADAAHRRCTDEGEKVLELVKAEFGLA